MTTNEPTADQWAAPVPASDTPPPPPAWATAPPPSGATPPPPPPTGFVPAGTQGGFIAPGGAAAPPPPRTTAPPSATQPITFRSWQPGIVALRPLPFGDFLTAPFKAMRFNRAAIVGGPLLVFSLASILTAGAIWLAFTDDKLQLTSADSFQDIESITVVGAIVALVAWIVADIFASAVVIPAVARAVLGEKLPLADALRVLAARFWHLALFGLIISALGTVMIVIALLPLLSSFGSDSGPSDASLGGMLAILVFIVFPLSIVYSAYVPVARAAIVMEKIGPIKALRRAFALMPGRFWWTVLIIFVIGIINSVVQQVFSYGTQLVAFVAAALSPDLGVGFVVALVVATFLQTIVTVVVQYSFVGSAYALIYLDLRMRKEGLAFELAKAAEARHAGAPTVIV